MVDGYSNPAVWRLARCTIAAVITPSVSECSEDSVDRIAECPELNESQRPRCGEIDYETHLVFFLVRSMRETATCCLPEAIGTLLVAEES